jgi:hypothetical protein
MLVVQDTWCAIVAQAVVSVMSLGWLAFSSSGSGSMLLVPITPSAVQTGPAALALSHGARLVAAGIPRGSIVVTGDAHGLIWAALTHGVLPLPSTSGGCSSYESTVEGRR